MDKSKITQIEKEVTINRKLRFNARQYAGYDNTVTDEVVIKEMFDENVYQVSARDVADGIVIDIGGNVGMFSVYASILGAKKIVAFEPEEDNQDMFSENVRLNNLANVELYPFAVSGQKTEFEIYKSQAASKKVEYAGEIDCPKQKVEAVGINDILNRYNEIAVLKIDCEGEEYNIFKAINSDNIKKIVYITGEFHKTSQEEYGEFMARLSLTHNVHIFGQYDLGGNFYARKY